MALTRKQKENIVKRYGTLLEESDAFFITEYHAMTVSLSEQLRWLIRQQDGEYVVIKNTLFNIALRNFQLTPPEDLLVGPVGIVFSKGNLPGVAKAIIDFSDDHEDHLNIKGGMLGNDVFYGDRVEGIASMPTREELLAQIMGILVQPQQDLVNTLHTATGGVINVLQPATSQVVDVLQARIHQLSSTEDHDA